MINSDDDLLFELELPTDEPSESSFDRILEVPVETLDNSFRPSSSSPSIKENKKSDKQSLIPDRASSVTGIPQSQHIAIPQKPKHRNVEGFFHTSIQSALPALMKRSTPLEASTSSPIVKSTLAVEPASKKYNPSLFSEPVALPASTVPAVLEDDIALTFTTIFTPELWHHPVQKDSFTNTTELHDELFKQLPISKAPTDDKVVHQTMKSSVVLAPIDTPRRDTPIDNDTDISSATPSAEYCSSFSSDYTSDVSSVDSAYDTPTSSPQWQRISLSPEERKLSTPEESTFPKSVPNNSPPSDEEAHRLNCTLRFSSR